MADGSRIDNNPGALVAALAAARIGRTFNQYAAARHLRERLEAYLESRAVAPYLLVGEAAGYRGARVSGIAFTSERQLTGSGPAEATATIVQAVLRDLDIQDDVLLWNVVPTHPGTACSNRPADAARGRGRHCLRPRARVRTAGHRRGPPGRARARRALRPPPLARRRAAVLQRAG